MKTKGSFVFAALVTSILVVILVGLMHYNANLSKQLYASTERTLSEIAAQQKFNFDSEIEAEKSVLKSIASTVSYLPDDINIVRSALTRSKVHTRFEYLIISDTDGRGVTSNGAVVDVTERPYFKTVLNGETVIGEPLPSLFGEYTIIPLATPVYRSGKVTGLLVGTYTVGRLGDSLLASFDGMGYAFVIDKNGQIIISTKNDYTVTDTDNLFSSWETADFNGATTFDDVKTALNSNKSGLTQYTINGQKRLACYVPLSENGWNIIVVVPYDIIAAETTPIMQNAIFLAVAIVLCFGVLIGCIIIQQQKNMHKLEKVAYFDELTGIPNASKFKLDAAKILRENPGKRFVIIKMDIADFKMINEMFNYETGDLVVKAVAEAVGTIESPYFLSARVNSDEFLIFDTYEQLFALDINRDNIERLFREKTAFLSGHRIEFRYGRYIIETGEADMNDIVEKVGLAHRLCKKQPDKAIFDYDEALKAQIVRETELANRMEQALRDREYKLYLQPKYRLCDETVAGAEALVRWKDATGQFIYPNEFIPLFERNGFITKLDMYMLERVCEVIHGWIADGRKATTVSVNFSRTHLSNPNFVSDITGIIDRYEIPRELIEVELTETIIYQNEEAIEAVLEQLHAAGFTMSMDDFGKGYSSLGLLKNLALDTIKMDRSFFTGDKNKDRTKTVIGCVVDMAKKLRIHTVAEGVETKSHIDFLREIDCDIVQGYYYAKPMPCEDFK